MSELISRKEARLKGLSKYFTGEACKNNHIATRYVQSGTCEQCIRNSKSITIPRTIITEGELLHPEKTLTIITARNELQKARLQLQQQKLSIEQQKVAASLLRAETNSAVALERKQKEADRVIKETRKLVVKTELINIIVVVHPLDYEMVSAMVWGAAVTRDPLLRLEDIVSGRQLDEMRHVMYCFPEDKYDLLKLTMQIYEQRFKDEFEEKHKARQLALAALSSDSRWPEGDPL